MTEHHLLVALMALLGGIFIFFSPDWLPRWLLLMTKTFLLIVLSW